MLYMPYKRTKEDIVDAVKDLQNSIERDVISDRKVLDTLFISLRDVDIEDVIGAIKTTLSLNMGTLKELEEDLEQLTKENK